MKILRISRRLVVCACVVLAACHRSDSTSARSTDFCDCHQSPFTSNDLSNRQINCFAEDSHGYIWIGTFRGLNRYNAHEYEQYFCVSDSLGLPDNQIKALLLDSQKRLWISTVNGPCIYTEQEEFHRIPITASNRIGTQLVEDRKGGILMNTTQEIFRYNAEYDRFERLPLQGGGSTMTLQIHVDAYNHLWCVTPGRLVAYDPESGVQIDEAELPGGLHYSYLEEQRYLWLTTAGQIRLYDTRFRRFIDLPEAIRRNATLMQSQVELIHPYTKDQLLLVTAQNGWFCYNRIEERLIAQGDNEFPIEVPRYPVSQMFTDSQQNLWIGSQDQGYTICYRYKDRFNTDTFLRTEFTNRSVSAAVATAGNLWIATRTDGAYRYDLTEKKLYDLFPGINGVSVHHLLADNDGSIWMSLASGGVAHGRLQGKNFHIENYYYTPYAMSLVKGADGSMWLGTTSHQIWILRPGSRYFEPIDAFPSNTFTFTASLLPLEDGSVLAAALMQPLRIVRPDGTSCDAPLEEGEFQACIHRSVFIPTDLFRDSRGVIWIGTVCNGMIRYDLTARTMQAVRGLSCSDISAINEDDYGYLWVSTLHGLNQYDPQTGAVSEYYASFGLGGNQFNDRSTCRLADGSLVFGGTHGLTIFDPQMVPQKRRVSLCFEHLRIHNKRIDPTHNPEIIDKELRNNPDIHLRHNHHGFSISFSALEYSEFDRVNYFYKLEDYDTYWIDARNNREAYYANLPAGTYTFRVRIVSNDRSIAESANSIRIIVHPAPWRTGWAYAGYLLGGLILLFFVGLAIRRARNNRMAIRRAEEQQRREKELNAMTKRFFANVSHEFRTPLTLIAGPITQLCADETLSEENHRLLQVAQRSSNRMLELVSQIMDFSKLEHDTLRLEVNRTDVIDVLLHRIEAFEIYIKNKEINLQLSGLEGHFEMWLDADKVDKIFSNLMSNALKWTPHGGRIAVELDNVEGEKIGSRFGIAPERLRERYITISVANTGPTIPEEHIKMLFERFYQVRTGAKTYGTGIGLYYARALVEMHHGAIGIENMPNGEGVTFTFVLPTDDEAYALSERHTEPVPTELPHSTETAVAEKHPEGETSLPEGESETILVIDDDMEIVRYISLLLAPKYRVIYSNDAEEGMRKMEDEAPDLVLCDVVLPGMDGFTFCRTVKENSQLCHTPVILVTAKTTVEDQVEGLDTGADAYVTKPFEPTYLTALIKSQLKNRERLRTLLGRTTETTTIEEEDLLAPQDKVFMTELYKMMESELSNPEFDIARVTDLLHISRTKFFYKIKGLTGTSPSIFFKTYKLNRAAELLAEGHYTISEIADMTGFSTLSHFSKSFKKQFGKAPSEWQNRN